MNLKLGKTIGKGGQSEVVCATWDDSKYALKLFQNDKVYEKELKVLKDIKNNNCQHLAKYYFTTKIRDRWCGILLHLYGIDVRKGIKQYFQDWESPAQMPIANINRLALKMLKCIEEIHSLGYVHCDIKPENFMYTKDGSDTDDIVLIDFGMVHKYRDSKNKHIQYGQAEDFKGTPSFSSLGSLKGFIQSRRDDMEAFWYILMYASTGELPWQKYREIADYQD